MNTSSRYPEPKKPLSPYMLFIKEQRLQIVAENEGDPFGKICRLFWRQLSDEKKQEYHQQHQQEKTQERKALKERIEKKQAKIAMEQIVLLRALRAATADQDTNITIISDCLPIIVSYVHFFIKER